MTGGTRIQTYFVVWLGVLVVVGAALVVILVNGTMKNEALVETESVSMKMPLSNAYEKADRSSIKLSGYMAAVLFALFGLFFILTRRFLLTPLRAITDQALLIIARPANLGAQIPEPKGRELRELVVAFNRMSEELKKVREELEQRVRDRTTDIEKARLGLEKEIAERLEIEKSLRLAEARYRLLFENMGNAVAIYQALDEGEDFVLVDFNRAAENAEQVSKESLIGRKVTLVFPGVEEFGLLEVFRRVWRTGQPELYPVAKYRDERIEGWRENFVYRLPNGDLVAVYSDETERVKAREALKDSEAKYRAIFENAAVGIHLVNEEGRFVDANSVLCHFLGYTPDELNALTILDVTHPDDLAASRARLQYLIEGKADSYRLEKRYIRKDGRPVWADLSVSALRGPDGRFQSTIGVVADITEQRRLREEHRRVFNYSLDLLCVAGFDGYFKQVNPAWQNTLGWGEQELLKKQWIEFVHPDDRPNTEEALRRLMAGETVRSLVNRYQHKDGNYRWISWNSFPVADESLIFAVARDVTLQRQAEETLRESEERFRLLYERSPLGYQSLDQHGRVIQVNQAWLDTLGYEKHEVVGRWFGDFLAPESRELFRSRFSRFKELGEVHSVEFRMIRKNGSLLTVSFDGKVAYDSGGKFVRTHCIMTDIDERKRAEEALRESEEKYRSMVETIRDVIYEIDGHGHITYVSPIVKDILGYGPEDIIGKIFMQFVHPEDQDLLINRFERLNYSFALCGSLG